MTSLNLSDSSRQPKKPEIFSNAWQKWHLKVYPQSQVKHAPWLSFIMKTTIIILFLTVTLGQAQWNIQKHLPSLPNGLNDSDFSRQPPQPVILDPIRTYQGVVVKVDKTWLAFSGKVLELNLKGGVHIEGRIEGATEDSDFVITNFPYQVADRDVLPTPGYVYLVKDAGYFTYRTQSGNTRTIHKYDYGTPYTPPPLTPEQMAAHKAEVETKKEIAAAKALESDQAAAARDDTYGLLRMAERYRNGEGVETNLVKARVYFMRAAEAGSTTASNALIKLNK